jgi:hypothetical protein
MSNAQRRGSIDERLALRTSFRGSFQDEMIQA